MSMVFSSFSWKGFIQYTVLVLMVYYVFLAWWYRKDLLSWWRDRRN